MDMVENRMTTHKVDKFQFNIVEEYTRAVVMLEHPDDISEYYIVAVSSPETPWWFEENDVWEEYYKEMRKAIEERYNKSGYWHEVKITLEFICEDKIYKKEI